MPPGRRRNRGLINGVMVGAILVLSLFGVGALVLTGLGPGLAGGSGDDAAPPDAGGVGAGSGGQGPARTASGPSEPSWMSDEEIAALEEFGRDHVSPRISNRDDSNTTPA